MFFEVKNLAFSVAGCTKFRQIFFGGEEVKIHAGINIPELTKNCQYIFKAIDAIYSELV